MKIALVKMPPDGARLKMAGRLDTTSAPAAQDALLKTANEYANLLLDFAELEYVSSAGLRALLATQKQVNKNAGSMVLENVSPSIIEVFEMTGFSGILTSRQ